MAKVFLRLNSEPLKTFHRRLCHYNYCRCRTFVFLNQFTQQQNNPPFSLSCCRLKSTKHTKNEKQQKDINSLVQPVSVKPYIDPDGINIGEELTGTLKKGTLGLISWIYSFNSQSAKSIDCRKVLPFKYWQFDTSVIHQQLHLVLNTQPMLCWLDEQSLSMPPVQRRGLHLC